MNLLSQNAIKIIDLLSDSSRSDRLEIKCYTDLTAQIHMPVDINDVEAVVMGKYIFLLNMNRQ